VGFQNTKFLAKLEIPGGGGMDAIKLKELSVEGMNALWESRVIFIKHLKLVSFCHHTHPNLLIRDSQQIDKASSHEYGQTLSMASVDAPWSRRRFTISTFFVLTAMCNGVSRS